MYIARLLPPFSRAASVLYYYIFTHFPFFASSYLVSSMCHVSHDDSISFLVIHSRELYSCVELTHAEYRSEKKEIWMEIHKIPFISTSCFIINSLNMQILFYTALIFIPSSISMPIQYSINHTIFLGCFISNSLASDFSSFPKKKQPSAKRTEWISYEMPCRVIRYVILDIFE